MSSHFDAHGASKMVDVSDKPVTTRQAVASGKVRMSAETLRAITDRRIVKGDVFEVARLAGIMAAKKTADLIPLCHPLPLDRVSVDLQVSGPDEVTVTAYCGVAARTGVEMEALVAVSVACLTVYDMCKSMDRGMTIDAVRLESKSGGKSGEYRRSEPGT